MAEDTDSSSLKWSASILLAFCRPCTGPMPARSRRSDFEGNLIVALDEREVAPGIADPGQVTPLAFFPKYKKERA